MKGAQIHSRAHGPVLPRRFNPYFCLVSTKSPENGTWQNRACYKNTEETGDVHLQFSSGWTIIRRSYLCSSLAPSSWAGRRRCLTQGDRCRVLNTAPDRPAAGHHNSLLSSLQSTRTPRARTHRGRHTEGPHSPLRRGGWVKGTGGVSRRGRLIIIISSPSMKAVFFASHPEVNHPTYNSCIGSTTLHFIGHLEPTLW